MKFTFTKLSNNEYEVHAPLMTTFPTLIEEVEKHFKNTVDFQIVSEKSSPNKTIYIIEITKKIEEPNENS